MLLCDKININAKNKNGFTPLHFCVLGNNIIAIKKLITAGANISIKNNENETCINLADKKNNKEIKNMITQKYYIMKYSSCAIFCFYLFHIIMPLLLIFFVISLFYNIFYIFIYIIWNFILFIVIYYFNKITTFAFLRLLEKNKSGNLLKLIENKDIDISNYCPKCKIYKNYENNIKHCYKCDCCIENFDHHCIWMGKCLGKNNQNIFFLLIVLIELNFIINTLICIVVEPLFGNKYTFIIKQLNIESKIHILFIINLIISLIGSIIIVPLIKSNSKKLFKFNKKNFSFNEKVNDINKESKFYTNKYYNESLISNK